MTHPTHAPLSALSIDAVNVRKTGGGAEPIFAASIRAKGIIEPLTVRANGKGFTITNGGKRYEALKFLAEKGDDACGVVVTDSYPVPITVRQEDDSAARETSLMTNIVRADMHPVDRYRAFAKMETDGKTREQIGAEYAMTRKQVDQVLALGALAPKVQDAWLVGSIDADAAQAFTLAPDHKTQDKLLERLDKQGGGDPIHADDIKNQLKANENDGGKLVEFVGVEIYEQRGGKVTRDLFGSDHIVSNLKLAKAMADERLAEECKRLVGEGWAWAVPKSTVNDSYAYGTIRIEPKPTDDEARRLAHLAPIFEECYGDFTFEEAAAQEEHDQLEQKIALRAFTPEQRAKSGCFVAISDQGQLRIEAGRVKPAEKKKVEAAERAKTKPAKKAADAEPVVSQALTHRLTVQVTQAAAKAIVLEPDVAFVVGIAALLSSTSYGTGAVELKNTGMGAREKETEVDFETAFKRVMKLTPKERMALFAAQVGDAFNFQNATLIEDPDVVCICNAMAPKGINAALRATFDAKDYFDSVPKALCLRAITEAVNADEARKVSGNPKADIAKFATANVPKTGWLPPELRTTHYDGPTAKAKAAPAAKAKPAPKAKKPDKRKRAA